MIALTLAKVQEDVKLCATSIMLKESIFFVLNASKGQISSQEDSFLV